MSDAELQRMNNAKRLMDDPALTDAFKSLEDTYLTYWRDNTALDDVAARERLWQAIHIVAKVRNHLITVAAGNSLPMQDLEKLAHNKSPTHF